MFTEIRMVEAFFRSLVKSTALRNMMRHINCYHTS